MRCGSASFVYANSAARSRHILMNHPYVQTVSANLRANCICLQVRYRGRLDGIRRNDLCVLFRLRELEWGRRERTTNYRRISGESLALLHGRSQVGYELEFIHHIERSKRECLVCVCVQKYWRLLHILIDYIVTTVINTVRDYINRESCFASLTIIRKNGIEGI